MSYNKNYYGCEFCCLNISLPDLNKTRFKTIAWPKAVMFRRVQELLPLSRSVPSLSLSSRAPLRSLLETGGSTQ
jgi:hypothetical protein